MPSFQVPVGLYMTPEVVAISPADFLETAYRAMADRGISSLAVTEDDDLVGLITRTDLLRVGKREAGAGDASVLTFPSKPVSDEMTRRVWTVTPEAPLAEAAGIMRKHFVHRVFVVEGDRPVGVLSTRDLLRAIEETRSSHRIGEYMTSQVFTIRDEEPLREAVVRLERGHVSGLVVVEEGWPVGIFGTAEALDSRDLPGSVAVGDVMNPRILVLPSTTSLHRAAAQARALAVRRVVIQDGEKVVGILSGLDFARAVS